MTDQDRPRKPRPFAWIAFMAFVGLCVEQLFRGDMPSPHLMWIGPIVGALIGLLTVNR